MRRTYCAVFFTIMLAAYAIRSVPLFADDKPAAAPITAYRSADSNGSNTGNASDVTAAKKGAPTIAVIKGHGRQKGLIQQWRGEQFRVLLLNKIKVEIVAKDKDVESIKNAIIEAARTGQIGDGKIFVYPIAEAIKIRSGETGDAIL